MLTLILTLTHSDPEPKVLRGHITTAIKKGGIDIVTQELKPDAKGDKAAHRPEPSY